MGLASKAVTITQWPIYHYNLVVFLPLLLMMDVYVYRLGDILLEWTKESGFYSRLYIKTN